MSNGFKPQHNLTHEHGQAARIPLRRSFSSHLQALPGGFKLPPLVRFADSLCAARRAGSVSNPQVRPLSCETRTQNRIHLSKVRLFPALLQSVTFIAAVTATELRRTTICCPPVSKISIFFTHRLLEGHSSPGMPCLRISASDCYYLLLCCTSQELDEILRKDVVFPFCLFLL